MHLDIKFWESLIIILFRNFRSIRPNLELTKYFLKYVVHKDTITYI